MAYDIQADSFPITRDVPAITKISVFLTVLKIVPNNAMCSKMQCTDTLLLMWRTMKKPRRALRGVPGDSTSIVHVVLDITTEHQTRHKEESCIALLFLPYSTR